MIKRWPLALAVVLAASCSSTQGGRTDSGSPVVVQSSDADSEDVKDREKVPPFDPQSDDVYPSMKRVAGRVVQQLSTYSEEDSWSSVVERVATRFDIPTESLRAARPLYVKSTSSVSEIVYPQLGGLQLATDPASASVMVVVNQQLEGGPEPAASRTVDVRMVLEGDRWRVESIDSGGGEVIDPPPDLSRVARGVLSNPDIELAGSARWDIYRGGVDERLLRLMAGLARRYSYSVTVLTSGHPVHVFGTEHVSNHTEGRAVDIWKVGEYAVVSQRDNRSSPAFRLTQRVFETSDVPEIGSPWDFDGGGSRSFTNDVHLDHIHLGYDAGG